MKFLRNLFIFIFAFIFSCVLANADDIGINSLIFDNSANMIVINANSQNLKPNISISSQVFIPEEKKIIFDIKDATITDAISDLYISSNIKKVSLVQYSTEPKVVRMTIEYDNLEKPTNIQPIIIGNSIIFKLNQFTIQNYYFQPVYSDVLASVSNVFEQNTIKNLVHDLDNDIVDKIDSAFHNPNHVENYSLTKKNQLLQSKYYVDNISIRVEGVHITGVGSATITKPFVLSNPNRFVYDLPNTIVNHVISGKEFELQNGDKVKIGQFDSHTARIVITPVGTDKYLPVMFGDNQHILFVNKSTMGLSSLFSKKYTLNSIVEDKIDSKTHAVKLIFSGPVIYGIDRTSNNVSINFYNVDKYQSLSLNNYGVFSKSNISMVDGILKYSLVLDSEDVLDIQSGLDAKTIRIKVKSDRFAVTDDKPINNPEPKPYVPPVKINGKHIVVIDAGHGGTDCGATRNSIYEKNITLDISKRIQKLLTQKGYVVYMTRSTDEYISLQDRVEYSEAIYPDVFVSVHVNSSNSDSPNGIETHYYKDNSLQLAKTVHASMLNNIKANNRGLFKSKFYVINHTTAPAILVEIGFISNANERAQLVTETRKQATAKAIAEGIDAYFK